MLNCGFKLTASTGSDWFVCSGNRVYADTGGQFSYGQWVDALQNGATFITNGPALFARVDDRGPGCTVEARPGDSVQVDVSWESHYAVNRVEVIWNGQVVSERSCLEGCTEGRLQTDLKVPSDGWIAARLGSSARDSFFQPIYAHTSPVYVHTGRVAAERARAADGFLAALDRSLEWVGKDAKFHTAAQRKEVRDLFRQGREVYRGMMA